MGLGLLTSRLDEVRPLILDSVPWSPFDFIRGISTQGDRAVQVAALLRNIDPADDLRFTHAITADTEVAVCAERLPWDSNFFGYGVARLHGIFPLGQGAYSQDADYTGALDALTGLAGGRGVRYLFAVVDARDLPTSRALTARGFSLIETRMFFHSSLHRYEPRRRFRVRQATEADLPNLIELANSVENSFDRFSADPFITKADTRRLMETWLRASVLHGFADATFIPDTPSPGAVCTVKYHQDKSAAWNTSIGQMMLAMASPRSGNGLVGLISEVNQHMKERGIDHMVFSTQIANRSAIRVGEHLGYKIARGEYVFRRLLS